MGQGESNTHTATHSEAWLFKKDAREPLDTQRGARGLCNIAGRRHWEGAPDASP